MWADVVETMEKPRCLCLREMEFFMDNKVARIWKCPICRRLFWESKTSDAKVWYTFELEIPG